ncbi:MAG: hypothetical protein ABI689_15010 [Thermoanaerobaculia bacterium]
MPALSLTPPDEATPAPGRASGSWRLAATLLVAALAGLALTHHRGWLAEQRALAAQASAQGLAGPELADVTARMRREGDPTAARLALAARLFDLEIANTQPGTPASAERLLATRELARAALRAEPASWQAAMLLGATVSLERSRNRDPRIYSLARDWERPLLVAGELAPAEKQPRRLLAAAYLEVWPALTPEKRKKVEELLREAFLEPQTFERLFVPWVAIAGSLERAATLLPDQPLTWKRLAATALERGSWSEYDALTARHRASLRATLERDLARAATAASGSGSELMRMQEARRSYSAVLAAAPVDAEFAPLVETALGLLPPGPAAEAQVRAAAAWLEWALPLCLVRDCPFAEGAMSRLASLAGSTLAGGEAAFAALAAGDRARADLLERRSDELWSEPWAPFLTFKARQLAAHKEIAAARAALLTVHRAFRVRLAWRTLAERIGAAGVNPGPALARESWEAADWWFDKGASRLDLLPSRRAAALTLEFAEPARAAALLEVQWDGRVLPPLAVAAGAAAVRLPLAVADEPHLLEIRVRAGDLRPAVRVRLE